jgi:major membrane immunogen (membrane-anchored lipoprotein)
MKTLRIVALVLVLAMSVMMLASCSKYNSIKSDFEDAGYTLQNEDNEKTGTVKTDDGELTYTIHTFQKEGEGLLGGISSALSTAIVWEFESDKDLAKAMAENEDMKDLLTKAQESELVNGNCFLMTINPDAIEIFNQSK